MSADRVSTSSLSARSKARLQGLAACLAYEEPLHSTVRRLDETSEGDGGHSGDGGFVTPQKEVTAASIAKAASDDESRAATPHSSAAMAAVPSPPLSPPARKPTYPLPFMSPHRASSGSGGGRSSSGSRSSVRGPPPPSPPPPARPVASFAPPQHGVGVPPSPVSTNPFGATEEARAKVLSGSQARRRVERDIA
jgi:hypothetical protein